VEEISGMIGAAAASQLMVFVRLDREMPSFESIVAKPMDAQLPRKPDAQMLVCYSLAHRVNPDNVTPVLKYVDRLPKEFGVTFANAACKRDYTLVKTPAVRDWAKSNAALMALINKG
jgi:hypothetical protein